MRAINNAINTSESTLGDKVDKHVQRLIEQLPSREREGRTFWWLRRRALRTFCYQVVRRYGLQVGITGVLTVLLWIMLYALFREGFVFLRTTVPYDLLDETIELIFGFFFVTMMVMLAFSAAIILYGTLFRSDDVAFFMTLPVRSERIFLHKLQEATFLASWAFIMAGTPMLLSYAQVFKAHWVYYLLLVPYLVFFSYIPSAFGAAASLLLVYVMPQRKRIFYGALGTLFVAVVAVVTWSVRDTLNLLAAGWFEEVLNRFAFTQHRLLPSWWLVAGLLKSSQGQWNEATLFLCVVVANALFLQLVCVWLSAVLYRPTYCKLQAHRTTRKSPRLSFADRLFLQLTRPLSEQMRWCLVKDFRLFRRDPVQWSQFLIFLGLFVLYFLNIRRFTYNRFYAGWVNMISLLNVAVVGLLLSTFTTRFVFPMISLEGRRFWVLGLLPIKRDTIVWSKFSFAAIGSTIPSCLLVGASDAMLQLSPAIIAVHQFTCLNLCIGLAGISVGLGAKMPDLREQSPAKIAAGFGGTVNLLISTAYIAAVLVLCTLPVHLWVAATQFAEDQLLPFRPRVSGWLLIWMWGGMAASVLLTAIVTAVPLMLGLRAFRKLEF